MSTNRESSGFREEDKWPSMGLGKESLKGYTINNPLSHIPQKYIPFDSHSHTETHIQTRPNPPLQVRKPQQGQSQASFKYGVDDRRARGPVRIPGRLLWLRHNRPTDQNQYQSSWTTSQHIPQPLDPPPPPIPTFVPRPLPINTSIPNRYYTASPSIPIHPHLHHSFLQPHQTKPGRSTAPPTLYLNTTVPSVVSQLTPPDSALLPDFKTLTHKQEPHQLLYDQTSGQRTGTSVVSGATDISYNQTSNTSGLEVGPSGSVQAPSVHSDWTEPSIPQIDPQLSLPIDWGIHTPLDQNLLEPSIDLSEIFDVSETQPPPTDNPPSNSFDSHTTKPSFTPQVPLTDSNMTISTITGHHTYPQGMYSVPFKLDGEAGARDESWMNGDMQSTGWLESMVRTNLDGFGGNGRGSVSSMSVGTEGSQQIKGQRATVPLSMHQNDVFSQQAEVLGEQADWGIDISSGEEFIHLEHDKLDQTVFDLAKSMTSNDINNFNDRMMYPSNQHTNQDAMYYPSQSLNAGERPLPVASKNVPINGTPTSGQAMQSGTQWAVPVIQRGDQYFWDNENPIQSAASYTYGAQGQAGGRPVANDQVDFGGGRSIPISGMAGSRSAVDTLSHQNMVPQIARTFHGYTGGHNSNMNFTAPMTAHPAGSMSGSFGNNLFVPPSNLHSSRSQESLAGSYHGGSQMGNYPQTPSPQKRSRIVTGAQQYVPGQILRSAAPEPEAPSAFMMAYQGNYTPGSAQQSRMPPSTIERPSNAMEVQEEDDFDEMGAYEAERLRNIRRNAQLMESLGLGDTPQSMRHNVCIGST